jgi:hypothetical protein
VTKKNILLLSCACLAFVLVISLSEVIYTYNNRPQYSGVYYFWLAKYYANKDIRKSIKHISQAAKRISRISYPTSDKNNPIFPEFDGLILGEKNDNFVIDYRQFISETTLLNIPNSIPKIAKEFYKLGLIAYNDSEIDLADELIKVCTYLDPDFSYYHVELANIYLTTGRKDEAEKVLVLCSDFAAPKKHCEEYYNYNLIPNTPERVGFLEDYILGKK